MRTCRLSRSEPDPGATFHRTRSSTRRRALAVSFEGDVWLGTLRGAVDAHESGAAWDASRHGEAGQALVFCVRSRGGSHGSVSHRADGEPHERRVPARSRGAATTMRS